VRPRSLLGMSNQISILLGAIIILSIGVVAYSYLSLQGGALSEAQRREAELQRTMLSERLTLIYWSSDGKAVISNDGPYPVNVVRAYVDSSTLDLKVQIQPGEKKTLNVGTGSELMIETESGGFTVLRS